MVLTVPRALAGVGAAMIALTGLAETIEYRDDVPLDEYLILLEQIAPAARGGAEAYLQAYRERCGTELGTVGLRRAMAEQEPAVIQMVRAVHFRNAELRQNAEVMIVCKQAGRRGR